MKNNNHQHRIKDINIISTLLSLVLRMFYLKPVFLSFHTLRLWIYAMELQVLLRFKRDFCSSLSPSSPNWVFIRLRDFRFSFYIYLHISLSPYISLIVCIGWGVCTCFACLLSVCSSPFELNVLQCCLVWWPVIFDLLISVDHKNMKIESD